MRTGELSPEWTDCVIIPPCDDTLCGGRNNGSRALTCGSTGAIDRAPDRHAHPRMGPCLVGPRVGGRYSPATGAAEPEPDGPPGLSGQPIAVADRFRMGQAGAGESISDADEPPERDGVDRPRRSGGQPPSRSALRHPFPAGLDKHGEHFHHPEPPQSRLDPVLHRRREHRSRPVQPAALLPAGRGKGADRYPAPPLGGLADRTAPLQPVHPAGGPLHPPLLRAGRDRPADRMGQTAPGDTALPAMIDQAVYRVRQFFRALTAPLAREDPTPAMQVLTPAQRALFLRMSPADQRHGLAVYRTLVQEGPQPRDLLVAALLHDVGKAATPMPLWVRVVVVLLDRFMPHLLDRLSEREARGWQKPFVVYRHHAEIGARWAAEAECSRLTVDLIRRHHEPVERPNGEMDRLLQALQRADGFW
ncbi:MAG TPA: HD domain-containing protein [Anaerolineae bacterium]|nr:HD domain-containing protein [Anaerolineae bacterium]